MATPLFTGNKAVQEYLSQQYQRERYHTLFSWQERMSKDEAHRIAFQKMLEEREKQRRLAQLRAAYIRQLSR